MPPKKKAPSGFNIDDIISEASSDIPGEDITRARPVILENIQQPSMDIGDTAYMSKGFTDYRIDDVVFKPYDFQTGETDPSTQETTEPEPESDTSSLALEFTQDVIESLLQGKDVPGLPERVIMDRIPLDTLDIDNPFDVTEETLRDVENDMRNAIIFDESDYTFNIPRQPGINVPSETFMRVAISRGAYNIEATLSPDGDAIDVYVEKAHPTLVSSSNIDIQQPKHTTNPGKTAMFPFRRTAPVATTSTGTAGREAGTQATSAASKLSVLEPEELKELLKVKPGVIPELRRRLDKALITPVEDGGMSRAEFDRYERILTDINRSRPDTGTFILKRKVEPQVKDYKYVTDKY
jgi:hypothetical protein